MAFNRLMWLCAGLFLLSGIPLFWIEDPNWARISASLALLFLGLFALAMAADGVAQGQIRFQFSIVRRAQRPRLFWATVGLVIVAGIGVLVTAAWAMFFKVW